MPTLKVIYDRDKEIENFVPKDFFNHTVHAYRGTIQKEHY
jgi:DNA topoisomerase IA